MGSGKLIDAGVNKGFHRLFLLDLHFSLRRRPDMSASFAPATGPRISNTGDGDLWDIVEVNLNPAKL